MFELFGFGQLVWVIFVSSEVSMLNIIYGDFLEFVGFGFMRLFRFLVSILLAEGCPGRRLPHVFVCIRVHTVLFALGCIA